MEKHDAFISFATEDSDFATELAIELKRNGLSIWFAPLSLKVGEKLLDSIEKGIDSSNYGVLLISDHYLEKGWTNYEMDILLRQSIEKNKTILPIWHGVTKEQVETRHSGLAGIVAVTNTTSIHKVAMKLIEAMSSGAPSRGVVPSWESPVHRFLEGLGEVNLNSSDGPAATIFEFLIHSKETDYPLWLGGELYTKIDLLLQVAQLLGPVPDRVKQWVGKKWLSDALENVC
jgi:hypothetical protein